MPSFELTAMAAVLVLGMLSLVPVLIASSDKLYIRPSEETPCPSEQCYLLTHVLETATEHFTSNTTVVLTPGHYVVSKSILAVIRDVSNLTLMGSPSEGTVIECREQFHLMFSNVVDLVISNLNFSNCTAVQNDADKPVGQLEATNTVMTLIDTSFSSSKGSSIHIQNSDLKLVGKTVFKGNKCRSGCGIAAYNSSLKSLGTVAFHNNTCEDACGIYSNHTTILLQGSAIFEGNKASIGGIGSILTQYSSLEFVGTAVFRNNTCHSGCSIFTSNSNVTFNGTTTFEGNEGSFGSGVHAVYSNLEFYGMVVFQNNTCNSGCGVEAYFNTNISFSGSASFEGNQARDYGSGIYAYSRIHIEFLGTAVFQNNTCARGCGVYVFDKSNISFNGSTIFEGNEATSAGAGGAIVSNSVLQFHNRATFHNNTAGLYGGALYLDVDRNAALLLDSGAELNITGNYALQFGGGIYIENPSSMLNTLIHLQSDGTCFYQCVGEQVCPKVLLVGNRAMVAGHAIYGEIYQCSSNRNTFEEIISIEHFHNESDLSLVTSDATRVCICVNGTPNCKAVTQARTVYPGETWGITVALVGDALGTTTGPVLAVIPSSASLAGTQISQVVQVASCTNLTYTVYSDPGEVTMQLVTANEQVNEFTEDTAKYKADEYDYYTDNTQKLPIDVHGMPLLTYKKFLSLPVYFNLTLLPCPIWFQEKNRTCICNQVLRNHGIFDCSMDSRTIYRPAPYWIMTSHSGNTTVVHEQCPLDYCMPHGLPIKMNSPDEQCQFNRSGPLCGGCKANLSAVFGSSQCLPCSHWWLFLIPLFALAGIVLVFLLTVLNLTVSIGTINGLIFYANIVRANMAVFFPPTHSTAVMIPSVFIAWLNLDLGIDVCFYDGLDTYAKTWLQLVFPAYVWTMMIAIIVSSHYFTWAARLSGKNAVPVLATLFLLSYAKLLRVIIATFSFTTLITYQSEDAANFSKEYVWLYDGNVQYLKGKHIPLFLAALVILVALSVPYTLVLISVQCLQRRSRYRVLFWLRRLKPLFDAYTGPYKDKHCYWTGLILLVRAGLFLFFGVVQNVENKPSLSLLAITLTAVGLLIVQGVVGGVYKLVYLNFLENLFLANLIFFSSAALYTALVGWSQVIAVYTSVGFSFIVFVIIVIHSAYKSLKGSRCIKSLLRRHHYSPVVLPEVLHGELCDATPDKEQLHVPSQILLFNEAREPVLEYCEENSL